MKVKFDITLPFMFVVHVLYAILISLLVFYPLV